MPSHRADAKIQGGVALVLIACGLYLLFSRLAAIGCTWDEYLDWRIAESYARHWDILANRSDPSQGRLAHLVAALSLKIFGLSYLAFKLPFALIGVGGGAWLCRVIARRHSRAIALAVTAYYFTNPYVLGSARTAATAGDVLVLVLALAFVLSLERWLTARDFWRAGFVCAVVCGAAVGAKWTNGALVPLALLAVLFSERNRTKTEWANLAKDLLCFLSVMALAAIATNPTFLLGLDFVSDALSAAHGYDQGLRFYLGAFSDRPPWYFVPAVFLAKYGVPFLVFFAAAVLLVAVKLWRKERVPNAVRLSLVVVALSALFAFKPFQSAYYYIFTVGPCLIVVAWFLRESEGFGARAGAAARWVFLAGVAWQAAQSFALAPDFLQAGREWGADFQGEFWGPAVNHCQGGPLALAALSTPGARVYVLDDCLPILTFDRAYGPVRPPLQLQDYPPNATPAGAYFVAVHRVFFAEARSASEQRARLDRFQRATSACEEVSAAHAPYRIFACHGDHG
jgi:4-amino-4-deoxy-L-arabinose transferase-like glycosyltransferase